MIKPRLFFTLIILAALVVLIIGLLWQPSPTFEVSTTTPQPGEIFTVNSQADGSWWEPGENLVILSDDTFTITNGVQVVTMTGPITLTKAGKK